MAKILLHVEGLAVLLLSVYVYAETEFSWLLFIILLFAPDLSMLGYLVDKKVGALIYNLIHTYSLAVLLIVIGYLFNPVVLAIGLILAAHIGLDRLIGYGLKYPTDFKDTHLNRV